MEKSANKLMKKAADCFELADTQQQVAERQHENADRQHSGADDLELSAHRLEALGHALEADAVQIRGNAEVVARGISPAHICAPAAAPASPEQRVKPDPEYAAVTPVRP